MLDFKDIQSTARETIAAGEYFTGQAVIADAGSQLAEIQSALGPAAEGEDAAAGFVVIVSMPTIGRNDQQTQGVALVYARFNVWVLVNPDANSAEGGAGKNLLEAVQNVVALLLDYEDDIRDHFETTNQPFQLMESAEGWLGYELEFEKQVALS